MSIAPVSDDAVTEFVTSSQAAKRLGLSMATIQKLVDNKVLQAWKTFGGHRRIALTSVLNYQNTNKLSDIPLAQGNQPARVMMVIESEKAFQQLSHDVPQWKVPFEVTVLDSVAEALLELLNAPHDLLVLQTAAPRKQQEKTLAILQKFMLTRQTLAHTLVLSEEPQLWVDGKSPKPSASIQVLNQDLSPVWLSAYLAGFAAQRQK
jgi:excisionase family DNA binding protein